MTKAEEIAKLRDTRDALATQLNEYVQENARLRAFLIAQAAILNATIAGMQAENQQRIHRGESIAYPERAFEAVCNDSLCNHNAAIAYLKRR
ncbi:MAG: hypothetical protein OEY86_07610 [Nitrospira sp.]|nr:hypothetical protein [Nitrospira sp.]